MSQFEILEAPWFSRIILVTPKCQNIDNLVETINKLEQNGTLRTIHIHINEDCLANVFPVIKDLNYVFRAYDNNTYQYYKWLLDDIEDKVHPYATSTAGATTMILSPDEQSVLLVYEMDMYKPVTGADHFGDISLNTSLREAEEEVGIQIDYDFVPKVIGFWNIGGRCGGKINNVMTCYIIKAKSLELKLDNFEITVAKWFKIEDLKEVINIAKNKEQNKEKLFGKYIFWSSCMDQDGKKFGYPYLLWLGNYLDGRWFENHVEKDNVNFIY